MAEIQKADHSGEMTRRFVEFVMMQAQNAALFLGEIPNPATGRPEVNLDLARMFIDQLEMIAAKTKGNLSPDEDEILASTLTQLRLSFVRAGGLGSSSSSPEPAPPPPAPAKSSTPPPPAEPQPEDEPPSRKKFTKSYGP